MPPLILADVKSILHLPAETEIIFQSNDRPNIAFDVRPIQFTQKSLFDLAYLIPLGLTPKSPPPIKFMLFMNLKLLCEAAGEMLPEFVAGALDDLRTGEVWGAACTDTAGMGIDNPDIGLVIQYQAPKSQCVLMQRFGRGARNPSLTARAVLFIEPKYLSEVKEERKRKAEAQALKEARAKEKAIEAPPRKRARAIPPLTLSLSLQSRSSSTAPFAPSPLARQYSLPPSSPINSLMDSSPPPSPSSPAHSPTREVSPCSSIYELPQSPTNLTLGLFESQDTDISDEGMSHSQPDQGGANLGVEDITLPAGARESGRLSGKRGRERSGKKRELDDAVDMFVNAHSNGLGCYRAASNKYFGNDKAKPLRCRDECERCAPKPIDVCCALCHPEAFPTSSYTPSDPPPSLARARKKTTVKLADRDVLKDQELRRELEAWRKQEAAMRWSPNHMFGSGHFLLADAQIKRIVDCAAGGVLDGPDAFRSEIEWSFGSNASYIDQILTIVQLIHPDQSRRKKPQLKPVQPLSNVAADGSPTSQPLKTPRRCGACGAVGHIATNMQCPKYKKKSPATTPGPYTPPTTPPHPSASVSCLSPIVDSTRYTTPSFDTIFSSRGTVLSPNAIPPLGTAVPPAFARRLSHHATPSLNASPPPTQHIAAPRQVPAVNSTRATAREPILQPLFPLLTNTWRGAFELVILGRVFSNAYIYIDV
ncbi:hypothetical protein BOTBODRAFT_45811 [Botryobasidium botryosum FD-172 SS1]|uniref:Helicase C-terminal domain-containing protein n=1 Tax=Botryobasidium botryosum (strain FD-172 SS1) TaxID=930990 RepID=A0A067MA79_BOTB1|nr:hypothetical protein BOTBODRAFT_45811 [Botryobasidium botryosum FD-172 SS1]